MMKTYYPVWFGSDDWRFSPFTSTSSTTALIRVHAPIFKIDDSLPTRTPAPLEFNSYINASDRLEEFIRYVGALGVRQHEVLKLPLELFVTWLIIEAAKFDGDRDESIPEVPKLQEGVAQTRLRSERCQWCMRFLSKIKIRQGITFCNPDHFDKHFQRALSVA